MRVATRRQRAAWRVFGDAFDPKRTARHRRRLRGRRGRPRRGPRPRRPDRGDRGLPGPAARGRRRPRSSRSSGRGGRGATAARAVLVRELDGERYRRWLDGYLAFVQAEGQGVHAVGPTEPHRVRDTMPSRVWAAYECVRAYEPVMRWADVTTLHDLRIAAKWLRYTLEFVREALGRDAGPVIEQVVALQDHLGWLHDADVAAGLARGVPRRARGRPDRGRERRDRALPRGPGAEPRASCAGPSARRGAACPASPSGARSGGSSPGSDRSAPRQHLDAVLAVVQDDERAIRLRPAG